jgi:hypothetical protein
MRGGTLTVMRGCDICHRGRSSTGMEVLRYGLNRQISRTPTTTNTSWGRGSIDLCDLCWTTIAKPRMRKKGKQ